MNNPVRNNINKPNLKPSDVKMQPSKEKVNIHRPEDNRKKESRNNDHFQSRVDLSIVIPLYNEEGSLKELAGKIHEVLSKERCFYEVLFIDDGSTDSSLQKLREINRTDKRFKCFSFRRNYGKSAALNFGFQKARGEIIITMDADLQDDPGEIPALVRKINDGYDLVSGWKKKRHDPITKIIPSKVANFVTRILSGIKIHDMNCGLKAYKKDVCKDITVYGELHRYIPVLAKQSGYKITEIPVQHHKRKFGKTKYGFSRFITGFLDLFTTLFTSTYSTRPLHFFGVLGSLFFLAGLGINIYLTILWYFNGIWLGGRPLLFLGVLLIILGIQFFSTGLLAEMVTRSNIKQEEPNIKEVIK
jgi:glycosyltransferase involved in cell wall biosynthesis